MLGSDLSPAGLVAAALTVAGCVLSLPLAATYRVREAAFAILFLSVLAQLVGQLELLYVSEPAGLPWFKPQTVPVAVMTAALVLPLRRFAPVGVVGLAAGAATGLVPYFALDQSLAAAVDVGGMNTMLVGIVIVMILAFEHLRTLESTMLMAHLEEHQEVVRFIERVRDGDLTPVAGSNEGLSRSVEELRVALQEMILSIRASTGDVGLAARDLEALAREQAAGAAQQSAAVVQTRACVASIQEDGEAIGLQAGRADELGQSAADRSEELASEVVRLLDATRQVGQVLAAVEAISSKSELLALNAALEGVRAGREGRGFALVAQQMQVLTGQTLDAVMQLKRLNAQLTSASEEVQTSMSKTHAEAVGSAGAAANIRAQLDRQQRGLGHAADSVREISLVTQKLSDGSAEVSLSAERLVQRVAEIDRSLSVFRLAGDVES